MSRLAAILDLGTNTFHLLIVRIDAPGVWKTVYKTRKTVKLGEGAIHRGYISEKAFRRGIHAMEGFRKKIDEAGVSEITALATSAIRGASNGRDFIDSVFRETGIHVTVITGEQEAAFICGGVLQTLTDIGERVLIMDIGGGSVEFIITDNKSIRWKRSFEIGAARLLELFRMEDPVQDALAASLNQYLESQLQPLEIALLRLPVRHLISASGSAESFARMIRYEQEFKFPRLGSRTVEIKLEDFFRLHQRLVRSSRSERRTMKGLVSMRLDMIVPASIITEYVLRRFNINRLSLSPYALKEGVAGSLAASSKV